MTEKRKKKKEMFDSFEKRGKQELRKVPFIDNLQILVHLKFIFDAPRETQS